MARASVQPESCLRCNRHMIPRAEWSALTKPERLDRKKRGLRQGSSRSLCAACMQYVRTHGELDLYAKSNADVVIDSAWHLCIRCGAGKRRPDGLCLDCVDVVHDLHELDRWVQPTLA